MIHAIPAALNGPVVHAQKLGRDGYVVPLCDSKEEPKTITNAPALVTCMCCLMLQAKDQIFATIVPKMTHEQAVENLKQLAQGT